MFAENYCLRPIADEKKKTHLYTKKHFEHHVHFTIQGTNFDTS